MTAKRGIYQSFQQIGPPSSLLYALFESLTLIRRCARTFRESCIEGLVVNKDVCLKNILESHSILADLLPLIGYENACKVVSLAATEDRGIPDVILDLNLLDKETLDAIIDKKIQMINSMK